MIFFKKVDSLTYRGYLCFEIIGCKFRNIIKFYSNYIFIWKKIKIYIMLKDGPCFLGFFFKEMIYKFSMNLLCFSSDYCPLRMKL